jgi:hypothetical protein
LPEALEYPVRVESMLFTMVDPHRGHEVAYNRWYERDHFYGGCLIGPWLFAGGRFVAPRGLKDLRFPARSPFADPVAAGSYLAVYWILAGHVDEHLKWAYHQVKDLYREGRGFEEKTHAHTGMYDLESVAYRDADPVPLELSLDHRFAGLAVVVVEPRAGVPTAGLAEALRHGPVGALLSAGGTASCSSWRVRASADTASARVPVKLGTDGGSPDRLVQLLFLDEEPATSWDEYREYAAAVEASGAGHVSFAAPFRPTVVGTDVYSDQLW